MNRFAIRMGTLSASVMLERFLFPPDQQYSYIENGGIIISGQILMNFSEIGFDLDELIAGKKYVYHTKDLDKTLANMDTETHRNFALKLLADIIVSKYSGTVSKMRDEDANNMKMLQSLANDWNGFSGI